ncbi:MAG TPA: mercury resistance system periplasmic binding protein MerP [Polaromonas sp.]|uniref:mercury resistance system periplasmic binding protein MerP n=1 Tax=Polaromonas sp. UBA4122 TaxID=1947074 RepID=UPI000EBCC55B|nr:mercury resistance system periplasmic binding protein MerP [Polaromonas sp. UBA4122]HAL36822.1 mercury resistance system periplasmic binding protein MerP [Polaromonas sp.]
MKNLIATLGIAITLAGSSLAASAVPKTVTLSVPSMDCPVCPITVKKALTQVSGVSQTSGNFGKREAVVTFDDAKTNVGAITESTKNAGYPSTVMGVAN